MSSPNFLFIGPDKTGSTWMYEVFRRHPECYVPEVKDLYFFDRYYDRGMTWYLSFFQAAPVGARAVGELSHDYIFSARAATRIAKDMPNVRLLTCLRDPADRAFSHYLFMVRNGRTRLPFRSAVSAYPALVRNSLYYQHLSEYYARFDRDQIKVLWFEELKQDPEGFAREIFDYLDVRFVKEIPYRNRVLPACQPRSRLLARAAKLGANWARNLGFARLVGRMKRNQLVQLLYNPYERGEKPVLSQEARQDLVDRFRPDVRGLEELLGVELEHWLTVANPEEPEERESGTHP